MVRLSLAAGLLIATLGTALGTGCVGVGPYHGAGYGLGPGCHGCDESWAGQPVPRGPVDGLRQWRRSLASGSGCGEVYWGEWTSYPPDSCSPCDMRGSYVDRPIAFRPLWLAGRLVTGLYGKRLAGADFCCDACTTGEWYGGGYEGYLDEGTIYYDWDSMPTPMPGEVYPEPERLQPGPDSQTIRRPATPATRAPVSIAPTSHIGSGVQRGAVRRP